LKAGTNHKHDPRPHGFISIGERVVVTQGPLEGTTGFLIREKNRCRVVLSLDLIKRSMSVEVDANAIARAIGKENNQWQVQSGKAI
jgi:transcription antitermination factor NusG